MAAQAGQARVAAHVRRLIEYRQLNFLEASDLGERFDVIFCRNVMIYFDRDVQQRVVSLLERHLAPGGYLFISHSESLNGIIAWPALGGAGHLSAARRHEPCRPLVRRP